MAGGKVREGGEGGRRERVIRVAAGGVGGTLARDNCRGGSSAG
jgi:hypothetical protein